MTTDSEKPELLGEIKDKLIRTKEEWAKEGRLLTGRPDFGHVSRLPPGQKEVKNWPVLDLGVQPNVRPQDWRLQVQGLVENPIVWTLEQFMAQPQEDFLSVRLEGPNIIVDRDGLTMTVKEGPPLLGDRTLDELIAALPEYRRDAARYTPDPAALETLRRVKQPTELLVFFGSWCPHCELAVPRLVRVLEDVHGAPLAVTFHGVPHDGWASDPMAENLRITGLPTVIVRRDSKEVARMEGDQWAAPEKSLAALVATPARR